MNIVPMRQGMPWEDEVGEHPDERTSEAVPALCNGCDVQPKPV